MRKIKTRVINMKKQELMKNLKRYLIIAGLLIGISGCDTEDSTIDLGESVVFVQFSPRDNGETVENQGTFLVPFGLSAASNPNGVTVDFTVEGLTSNANGNFSVVSSSVEIPAGEFNANVEVNLVDNAEEDGVKMIRLTISGVSDPNIGIGLGGDSLLRTFTLTINDDDCDLSVSTGRYLGEYAVTVPTGNSPFGAPQFAEGNVVELVQGPNGPNSRQFTAVYLEGLGIGQPASVISFTFNGGQVEIDGGISGNLACAGATENITLGPDPSLIPAANCPDDSTLTLNMIDAIGGSGNCGIADIPFTIVLTKV